MRIYGIRIQFGSKITVFFNLRLFPLAQIINFGRLRENSTICQSLRIAFSNEFLFRWKVSELIINGVQRQDDGLYECQARNEGGQFFKSGHIQVGTTGLLPRFFLLTGTFFDLFFREVLG